MKTWMFPALIVLVVACQPEPDQIKLLDDLVVATNYDNAVNFGSYQTFSMSDDTLGFYSNRSNDTILTNNDSDLVRPILQQVEKNMEDRGYTRVGKSENPTLGLNVYIVNNLNLFQQVVYPGSYYPYYYGYYPGYYASYPYVQTYQENTASLVVEIVDLVNRGANNEVKVIWAAYMGDLVSTVDRQKQSVDAIDQSFVQSPYIRR